MIVLLFIVVTIVIIVVLRYKAQNGKSELYTKYQYPNEDYYGKELYSEIDYQCSDYEAEIGETLVERAIDIASYTGDETQSVNEMGEVGAFSHYYLSSYRKDAVSQKLSLQFITCRITGDEGRVWVVETRVIYNENGEKINVDSNILTLWYMEKQENEWQVVRIVECP